jgi:hypothetical protein
LASGHHNCHGRRRDRVLLRYRGKCFPGPASEPGIVQFHVLRDPIRRLARTLSAWARSRLDRVAARQSKMETDLFIDGNCAGNCGCVRPRHQNWGFPRTPISEIRAGGTLVAFQFALPRVSIRPRRCLDGILWGSNACKLANRSCLFANRHPNRFFAALSRGALLVRCCLRGHTRNSICAASRSFFSSAGPSSAVRNRKLIAAEGVRFELTRPFGPPVFKTGAINRSATPPQALRRTVAALYDRRKPRGI